MRRALYELLLFLLPFALYFLYTRVAKRDEQGALTHAHPWAWLFIIGLGLVVASFIWLGLTEGPGSQGTYVPARNDKGEVVPGHFENEPAAPFVSPPVPIPPPAPSPPAPMIPPSASPPETSP